ncbi:hypothetical protein LTR60_006253, partial [Cryomyces antarcticus]
GARSPAGSDASHFTSVSQRGVNPNWRPNGPNGPNGPNAYNGPNGAGQRRRPANDVLLQANPDFVLPAGRADYGRGRGRGGRAPGLIPGMGLGTSGSAVGGGGGMTPVGRYPTDM